MMFQFRGRANEAPEQQTGTKWRAGSPLGESHDIHAYHVLVLAGGGSRLNHADVTHGRDLNDFTMRT